MALLSSCQPALCQPAKTCTESTGIRAPCTGTLQEAQGTSRAAAEARRASSPAAVVPCCAGAAQAAAAGARERARAHAAAGKTPGPNLKCFIAGAPARPAAAEPAAMSGCSPTKRIRARQCRSTGMHKCNTMHASWPSGQSSTSRAAPSPPPFFPHGLPTRHLRHATCTSFTVLDRTMTPDALLGRTLMPGALLAVEGGLSGPSGQGSQTW